ncbi:transposase [Pseudomonas sp. PP3]|uniref:transposase n=1 Tax=Pseudomonas sp. PP3 TaxID=2815936 RepID=UPI001BAFC4DD|nr:transposase [Pseudomonas sp. PP3]
MKWKARILLVFLSPPLIACAQSPTSDLDNDAIPTDLPLPLVGVNQRPVVGEKTVLLVAARWPGDRELNMQALSEGTFSGQPGSLSDYLLKASMGKLTLKGTTIKVDLPASTPPPNGFNGEIAAAQEAARAQGYEPNQYDYFWVVHDNGIGGAQGQMPGYKVVVREGPSRYGRNYIWAHEFGHNLGYSHEPAFGGSFWSYINCKVVDNAVNAPANCDTSRAGDYGNPVQRPHDITSLYPANYRLYSGWLDASQSSVISQSGLYRLGVLGGSGPQLYLIDRKTSSGPQQISIEYRKPTPPYDNFSASDNSVNGVWVRYTTMDRIVSNVQLDGTPETATTSDPTLMAEKTLKDEAAGVTIKVCTTADAGAMLAVAMNGETLPNCVAPLTPPTIQIPDAGAPSAQNPITFSGTSRPGALINVSYRIAGGNNWKDVKEVADATGKWQAKLPDLPPANYNGQVWQTIGNNASLASFRNFGIAP